MRIVRLLGYAPRHNKLTWNCLVRNECERTSTIYLAWFVNTSPVESAKIIIWSPGTMHTFQAGPNYIGAGGNMADSRFMLLL